MKIYNLIVWLTKFIFYIELLEYIIYNKKLYLSLINIAVIHEKYHEKINTKSSREKTFTKYINIKVWKEIIKNNITRFLQFILFCFFPHNK